MRAIVCLFAILMLQPVAAFDIAREPLPAWVKPFEPTNFTPSSDRYAGYTHQLLFDGDGVQAYSEIWIRAANPAGLDAAAQIEIPFDATYQHPVVHHVDVLRDGRLESRLARTKMEVVGRESDLDALLYTGRQSLLLVVDDVRIGDVVRYAYSVYGRNPVYEDRVFAEFPLAWDEPVQRVRYRLVHDGERRLQFRAIGNDAPDVKPRRQRSGKRTVLEWEYSTVPERPRRAGTPAWFVQHPFLQVSEYRSWGEVAAWAARLFATDADASLLTAHLPSDLPEADVTALVDFVQDDIRYYGIEIGQNSHRPHSPAVTIERRFGDCKDKSVLLVALLQLRGIDARPVLVSTYLGRSIGELLPSPSAFDHVIVEIEQDGRRIWIDPTRSSQSGTLAQRAVGDFGMGLPVDSNAVQLVTLDSHAQSASIVRSVEHFTLPLDDVERELRVETQYRGAVAEAYRAADTVSSRAMLEQQYLGYYARMFPDAEPQRRLAIEHSGDDVLVREAYRLGPAWQAGSMRLPVYAGVLRDYAGLPEGVSASRLVPLALPFPIDVTYEARVSYPAEVGFAAEPAVLMVEDDFISYLRSIEPVPGEVVIRHEYRTKRDHVPVAAIRDHIAHRRKVLEALDLELTFAHPGERRAMDRQMRLRRLLESP